MEVQGPEGLSGNHIGFSGERYLPRKKGEQRRILPGLSEGNRVGTRAFGIG